MPITVLLVDDSAVMRKVLTRALRQAGLEVGDILEAGDGLEALNVVGGAQAVNLVLCDWNMPNMNGIDFVAAARAKGFTAPIVMVTTEAGSERVQQATAAGADGFVTKPFTPERLGEALTPILAKA
ncbi:MAG: response regulator [Candidatus Polarisedimenticolia bacterium]|nr:response regulator [bacterium]